MTFKDLVFLSGQVPGDGQDVASQTRDVLARPSVLVEISVIAVRK